MYIGQPELATGVAKRQLRVIQTQQVQDRRVQVVEVDLFLHAVVAVLVGAAISDAWLDPAPG